MKKISLLIMSLFLLTTGIVAAPQPLQQQQDSLLPVIVRKKGKTDKHTCAPGQPINGTIFYEGNSLLISFPLDGDFFEVTVTSSENAAKTWTTTCNDATQIEMSFDGEAGEYYIEIATPDCNYTGWFEL